MTAWEAALFAAAVLVLIGSGPSLLRQYRRGDHDIATAVLFMLAGVLSYAVVRWVLV
ncbi:hypothetical protein [Lysobacter enzymogenes]|uniref:hypothetical protein n=1 Tax=Lysobacter enzymogenes TaxID=69 RepID=UPI0019D1E932|nr:hypothetical protein [Lysobacter enzymogenes]